MEKPLDEILNITFPVKQWDNESNEWEIFVFGEVLKCERILIEWHLRDSRQMA